MGISADGYDEEDAEQERRAEDNVERGEGGEERQYRPVGHDIRGEQKNGERYQGVDHLLQWEGHRAAERELLQLDERYNAPREADRPDNDAQEHRNCRDQRLFPDPQSLHPVELRDGDERSGRAPDPVERRDHLWHRRHLDPLGRDRPDHRANEHPGPDLDRPQRLVYVGHEDRRHERYHHADGGYGIPRTRRLGPSQAADARDEERGRHEVGQERPELHGPTSPSSLPF